jgi:hypothetical protein
MACLKSQAAAIQNTGESGETVAVSENTETAGEYCKVEPVKPSLVVFDANGDVGLGLSESEYAVLSETAKLPVLPVLQVSESESDDESELAAQGLSVGFSFTDSETYANAKTFMEIAGGEQLSQNPNEARTEEGGVTYNIGEVSEKSKEIPLTEEGAPSQVLNAQGANAESMAAAVESSGVASAVNNVVETFGGVTAANTGGAAESAHGMPVNPENVQNQSLQQGNVHVGADFVQTVQTEEVSGLASAELVQLLKTELVAKVAENAGVAAVQNPETVQTESVIGLVAQQAQPNESKEPKAKIALQPQAVTAEVVTAESKAQPQLSVNPVVVANEAKSQVVGTAIETGAQGESALGEVVEIAEVAGLAEVFDLTLAGTAVQKTVAAQVGEAIVAELERVNYHSANAGTEMFNAQTAQLPETVTAADVKQALNLPQTAQPTALPASETAQVSQISEFRVTLKPEHLGEVTVRLLFDEATAKMSVIITAATDAVRDLLMARAGSVRVMVELSGITVERYEVVTAAVTGDNVKASYLDAQEQKDSQHENPEQEQGEAEQDGEEVSFAEVVQMMQMMDL